MTYTLDHFIRKFEATKETDWCVGAFEIEDGRRCALGMCGDSDRVLHAPEADALRDLISRSYGPLATVACINDGEDPLFQQPTPRKRILAALYRIHDERAKA